MSAAPRRLSLVSPTPPQEPNYEVKNRLDVCVYTTNDASLARRWAKSRPDLGDLMIEEVSLVEVRKRVTTVRPKLALVPR